VRNVHRLVPAYHHGVRLADSPDVDLSVIAAGGEKATGLTTDGNAVHGGIVRDKLRCMTTAVTVMAVHSAVAVSTRHDGSGSTRRTGCMYRGGGEWGVGRCGKGGGARGRAKSGEDLHQTKGQRQRNNMELSRQYTGGNLRCTTYTALRLVSNPPSRRERSKDPIDAW